MTSSFSILEFDNSNEHRVQKVKEFLNANDLDIAHDVEIFVVFKEHRKIIACGGLSGNILKCVAVSEERRGEGIILKLMTHLLNLAYEKGRQELFLFSKPKNKELFEGCGFKLVQIYKNDIMLMENNQNLSFYQNKLRKYKKEGKVVGSIVMNANPFTLGHKYLVETAAKKSDWLHLFVVKEDASDFAFVDRLNLIRKGLKDIPNLSIHEGSNYIVSKATFPTYFIKDKGKVEDLYAKLDLSIFKNQIAPCLGITHRFVGTEPTCAVTNNYNKNMKEILEKDEEGNPPIYVDEIPRITYRSEAISASHVRKLLKKKEYEEISNIVPKSTYEFLMKEANI
jgi:[citrate (pro-3S)-lyase] ligase